MAVRPIPEGHQTVSPYLMVPPGTQVIEFLVAAFGATILCNLQRPDGGIQHAEVRVGDSVIMLSEVSGQWKPMPSCLHLYLPDVDAAYKTALAAGATSIQEPSNQFYGDRSGGVLDAAGNMWFMATHVEDVSEDEIRRRAEAHVKAA